MEDFKKRLFKENFELSLKTSKNMVFIKNNPKFKELSWGEQVLQWKQFIAQASYLEALQARIFLLTTHEERMLVRDTLQKMFLEIYQGGTLNVRETAPEMESNKHFNCIENILKKDGEVAADGKATGIQLNLETLYNMIMNDGVSDDGKVRYKASKPETKPELKDTMREAHQAGSEKNLK